MISNVTATAPTIARPTGPLFQDSIAELKQGAGYPTVSSRKSLETPPRSATNEALAAIEQLPNRGPGETQADRERAELQRLAEEAARTESASAKPAKTWLEAQAEAQRWERYFAHQPPRMADLLAVYYGARNPLAPIGHLADAPDEETRLAADTAVRSADDTQPRDN